MCVLVWREHGLPLHPWRAVAMTGSVWEWESVCVCLFHIKQCGMRVPRQCIGVSGSFIQATVGLNLLEHVRGWVLLFVCFELRGGSLSLHVQTQRARSECEQAIVSRLAVSWWVSSFFVIVD